MKYGMEVNMPKNYLKEKEIITKLDDSNIVSAVNGLSEKLDSIEPKVEITQEVFDDSKIIKAIQDNKTEVKTEKIHITEQKVEFPKSIAINNLPAPVELPKKIKIDNLPT